jgi:hypothetical protein
MGKQTIIVKRNKLMHMKDENFWKNRYADSWPTAADKEEKIRKIIEGECECKVEYAGLGAGSTEYLPGSAKSRGFKKGGSDLHITDTNIYIEVTGPNTETVDDEDDLWIRPDKINYAIDHPENDHWVVHVLKRNFYIRVVHINDKFKDDFRKGHFFIARPPIRGVVETYTAVPADSEHVTEVETLFEAVREATSK